jgi:hypothetical protein
VAQVLNYTLLGDDKGDDDFFWYRDSSSKCRYNLYAPDVQLQLLKTGMELYGGTSSDESIYSPRGLRGQVYIDLDNIDSRSIEFKHRSNGIAVFDEGKLLMPVNSYGPISVERLERGWDLIYSKYCTGKKKAW